MTRLLPPLLTAAAIWALCLAEGQAQSRAPAGGDDPACLHAASAPDPAPAPGCPDLSNEARP